VTRCQTLAVGAVVLSWVLGSIGLANAQVKATQWSTELEKEKQKQEKQPTEFKSPMLLEVPAKGILGSSFHGPWSTTELEDYYCDDVSIPKLTVYGQRRRQYVDESDDWVPHVRFVARFLLYTRPSHDRLVRARFEIMAGDKSVVSWERSDMETDEGRSREKRFYSSYVPRSDVEAAFNSDEEPVFRITLWVRDEE